MTPLERARGNIVAWQRTLREIEARILPGADDQARQDVEFIRGYIARQIAKERRKISRLELNRLPGRGNAPDNAVSTGGAGG